MSSDYIILNEEDLSPDNEDKETSEATKIRDPLRLSKNLQSLMLKLKGLNLMDDSSIDYKTLVNNELFKSNYLNLTRQLRELQLDQLFVDENQTSLSNDQSDQNIMAFFINIYNALTIHALAYLRIKYQITGEHSLLEQLDGGFWRRMSYKIDKYTFSLDDIEHGILRGNRPHPSRNEPLFKEENDERKKFIVKNFDSRIHFALNCGAKGCPPIGFYTTSNLNKALDLAASNFCTNETTIEPNERRIQLSRLFLWYKKDFLSESTIVPENEELIRYIGNYLIDEAKKLQFAQLMNNTPLNEIKIEYSSYNWTINFKE